MNFLHEFECNAVYDCINEISTAPCRIISNYPYEIDTDKERLEKAYNIKIRGV